MRKPADILRDFRDGEKLSDAELEFLRGDMQKLSSLSNDYGELFALTGSYAFRVAMDCESYLRARAEMRNKPLQ
jgi:hypothetical protein